MSDFRVFIRVIDISSSIELCQSLLGELSNKEFGRESNQQNSKL